MKALFSLVFAPFVAFLRIYRAYVPASVRKLLGITIFLLAAYGGLLYAHPSARSLYSHQLLGQRIGLYGILSLAAGMLIITGGIDLSMGSLVCLSSTIIAYLVSNKNWSLTNAFLAVLPFGLCVGLFNGLIVTKLRVQAFMVTLCGLFVFRSLARWLTGDEPVGLGSSYAEVRNFFNGNLGGVPIYLVILLVLAGILSVFLHLSTYGRYFFALGSNERAAAFSGIPTQRYRILAFVMCSLLTVLYSFLAFMKTPSVTPSSAGTNDELMAIAAAVLGGCTLRGGDGTIYGMLAGTAILQCLQRTINIAVQDDTLEGVIIGVILLLGTIFDEVLRTGTPGKFLQKVRLTLAAWFHKPQSR
jgi:ribose transport system permease protein